MAAAPWVRSGGSSPGVRFPKALLDNHHSTMTERLSLWTLSLSLSIHGYHGGCSMTETQSRWGPGPGQTLLPWRWICCGPERSCGPRWDCLPWARPWAALPGRPWEEWSCPAAMSSSACRIVDRADNEEPEEKKATFLGGDWRLITQRLFRHTLALWNKEQFVWCGWGRVFRMNF